MEGTYQEYYTNGVKRHERTYQNNQLHGVQRTWYKHGEIQEIAYYKEGNCTHTRVYHTKNRVYYAYYLIDDYKLFIYYILNTIEIVVRNRYNDANTSFLPLAKKQCHTIKEELMAAIYHPDRLDRCAKAAGMETMEYMDLVLPH